MKNKLTALALIALTAGTTASQAAGQRIQVTGEVIDTWCYVTKIMIATGTAHHQCAVWCAAGGIPVSIKGNDGKVYVVLKVEDDTRSNASPTLLSIQTHEVTVDGDWIERDGVNYLLVNQVADDNGIVDLNHEQFGIQPFGN